MADSRSLDIAFMKTAMCMSELSTAERKKVGSIIVRNGNILSMGYNGTPSGFDNVCEISPEETKPETLHAESNAICKMAKSPVSAEGATLYVTMSPCYECAKLIIQSGIKRVVYAERYRVFKKGFDLLEQAGITVECIHDIATEKEALDGIRIEGSGEFRSRVLQTLFRWFS